MRILANEPIGQFGIPVELAFPELQIDRKRDQKSIRHRIDERRAFLDGEALLSHRRIEGLQWQVFEPVRQTEYCRTRFWKNLFQPRRASKLQCHFVCLVHGSSRTRSSSRRILHKNAIDGTRAVDTEEVSIFGVDEIRLGWN